jgi:hypothetical protein
MRNAQYALASILMSFDVQGLAKKSFALTVWIDSRPIAMYVLFAMMTNPSPGTLSTKGA